MYANFDSDYQPTTEDLQDWTVHLAALETEEPYEENRDDEGEDDDMYPDPISPEDDDYYSTDGDDF